MKTYKMKINGEKYEAKIVSYDGTTATVNVNGVDFQVDLEHDAIDTTPKLVRSSASAPNVGNVLHSAGTSTNEINSPVSGPIVKIFVKEGDNIRTGDQLLTIEAMKMENPIYAPCDATVSKIHLKEGDQANEGTLIMTINPVQQVAAPVRETPRVQASAPKAAPKAAPKVSAGSGSITAPMAGAVMEVHVKVGDMVNENDLVVTLEAMKMENPIYSHVSGKVKSIPVSKGDSVQDSDVLIEIGE